MMFDEKTQVISANSDQVLRRKYTPVTMVLYVGNDAYIYIYIYPCC